MRNTSDIPNIGDYGLIGDCRTAALVSHRGSIDWYCTPDFHSPSIFARLLDRGHGGHFAISAPSGGHCTRAYIRGTNVLRTRFHTSEGVFDVIDFMAIPTGPFAGGLEPERELIRVIEAKSGQPVVQVDCKLRPDYARAVRPFAPSGKLGWSLEYGADQHFLRSDIELQQVDAGWLYGSAGVKAGERRYLSLSFVNGDAAVIVSLGGETQQKLEETIAWWRAWSRRLTYDGPFKSNVERSMLALKLLTSSLTGALVAAPTTSLPEAIGGERNWDRRYCWLRDASLTLRAFLDAGYAEEGAAFFDWLLHSTRLTTPKLQTIYDIYGRTDVNECELPHLEGFRNSRPVRIGNEAANQLQLDIYGSVILAASDFVERGGTLQRAEKNLLAAFGEVVMKCWMRPDNGIWEYRDRRLHNTYSKLMCWTALDKLQRLAAKKQIPGQRARRWAETRKAIRMAIEKRAWDDKLNTYLGAFGEPHLDAAVLLMARCGYLDANAPRLRATARAIHRGLARDGLIRRHNRKTDGFASREGDFLVCSCWYAEYLARAGENEAARQILGRVAGYANDLGLLSEAVDASSGTLLGNFPLAFSHLGLVNAGLALSSARQREGIR